MLDIHQLQPENLQEILLLQHSQRDNHQGTQDYLTLTNIFTSVSEALPFQEALELPFVHHLLALEEDFSKLS